MRGVDVGEISDAAHAAVSGHLGSDKSPFDPHSWRCYDKERYPGDCGCVGSLVQDVLAAVVPLVSAKAWQEGWDRAECMAQCWGHTDHWGEEKPYPTNPYAADD
jgi:hypothetical protein